MDTLDLVPFEGTQLQRGEDFDASKFHIKELRIKDLHKNLCKKPYFHVRLDSQKRSSTAAEPAEVNGEQHRSSLVTSDADYETCEEDGVASVPQDPVVPSASETQTEYPAEEQQPSNRTSKRKTRLPGKFRHDESILSDFSERYLKYYRRGLPKSKTKQSRLKEKQHRTETQYFEVPIEAHEVDVLPSDATATASGGERIALGSSKVADSNPGLPSERKAPTKPLKQIYSPSSRQKRQPPTTKHSRVIFDHSEFIEVSTDSEPLEGPSKTSKSNSVKRKPSSSQATYTEEVLSPGKRRTESKEKAIGSISVSKLKEKKGTASLKSESKPPITAPDGSTEDMMPTRWRLHSPSASVEEIPQPPTERKSLDSKLNDKKSKPVESKPKGKNGRTLESEPKRSYDAPPQASAGKRALESKSEEKKGMTAENKWKDKKSRTAEGESKRRHSTPSASMEDILPMKWRLPKEKWPLESKWKDKEKNRASEEKSKEKASTTVKSRPKQSFHAPVVTSTKKVPPKRKHSYSEDVRVEDEIIPSSDKKTPDGKAKDKKSKTPVSKSKETKTKTVDTELKQSSNAPDAKEGRAKRVRIPIRKLKSGYTSEDGGSSDEERNAGDGPGTSFPTFATEMKHSNVITCFWMGIPADFSGRHMPEQDQFVVLQDAKGLKWETNYLARKKGLSGGWRRFALDHHLDMGDIVIFELVKPLKFLVHITKNSGVEDVTVTPHPPLKEAPKKVEKLKHEAYTATKGVSSSALFSNRKKPRLAGGDKKWQEGSFMTPAAKPNRLSHPGKESNKKGRQSVGKETGRYEDDCVLLSSAEESQGDEEGKGGEEEEDDDDEEGKGGGEEEEDDDDEEEEEEEEEEEFLQKRRVPSSLPKFKHLSRTKNSRRDSSSRKGPAELELTVYKKSPDESSVEPPKAGPLSPKPPKKKIRRVSYFYSTDEDQGNSL